MNVGVRISENIANVSSVLLMAYLSLDGRECHGLSAQRILDSNACHL